MATVTVSFTPLPAHVRTARFIAASVARRAGVAESLLDEVRLAVSEACSLAVRQHRANAPEQPVELRLVEDVDRFSVQVLDAVGRPAPETARDSDLHADLHDALDLHDEAGGASASTGATGDAEDVVDLMARERIGLAVISGLVDDVRVEYLDGGSVVTMSWPLANESATGARPEGISFL